MATTETQQYRGYKIVPMRQWAGWCAEAHPTRADLPFLARSTLRTLASRKKAAEQATALSGAADEERIANRIADQEEKLAALFKQREALIGNA